MEKPGKRKVVVQGSDSPSPPFYAGKENRMSEELIIKEPGKFEGQPRFIPYFLERGLGGFADEEVESGFYTFFITKEDAKKFPELEVNIGYMLRLCDLENRIVAIMMHITHN